MAAVVLTPRAPPGIPASEPRLDIFPGASTPAVFAARTPFWIGYGFVQDHSGDAELGETTRFELAVDGEPVSTDTDLEVEDERTVSKLTAATFETGLPAGWHRFAGRWYVAGKLVLTSEASIEFVEP
jgi:hypothetical protein